MKNLLYLLGYRDKQRSVTKPTSKEERWNTLLRQLRNFEGLEIKQKGGDFYISSKDLDEKVRYLDSDALFMVLKKLHERKESKK